MEKQKNPKTGMVLAILAVVFLAIGVVLLVYSLKGRDKSGAEIDALAVKGEAVDEENIKPGPEPEIITEASKTEEANQEESDNIVEEFEPEPERKANPYKDYFAQNDDMAAWIYIPDTPIDYPVMYTPEDENYYLKRDFYKKDSANGCLILDTDSSMEPLSTNLIIHGHNMKSGAMFGTLTKYEDEDYCDKHRYAYLYGRDYEHVYEAIAVFRSKVYYKTDTDFKYYKFFNATTDEEFNDFYENIKALSTFDTGVYAEPGDRFLTLSTCAYHVENGRFVVVFKEIEPGDYYLTE